MLTIAKIQQTMDRTVVVAGEAKASGVLAMKTISYNLKTKVFRFQANYRNGLETKIVESDQVETVVDAWNQES